MDGVMRAGHGEQLRADPGGETAQPDCQGGAEKGRRIGGGQNRERLVFRHSRGQRTRALSMEAGQGRAHGLQLARLSAQLPSFVQELAQRPAVQPAADYDALILGNAQRPGDAQAAARGKEYLRGKDME